MIDSEGIRKRLSEFERRLMRDMPRAAVRENVRLYKHVLELASILCVDVRRMRDDPDFIRPLPDWELSERELLMRRYNLAMAKLEMLENISLFLECGK